MPPKHWSKMGSDDTVCGLRIPRGLAALDGPRVVHPKDWSQVDCPVCRPEAREWGEAVAQERREALAKEVTLDIEVQAQRVREIAFASAWVQLAAPSDGSPGAERRARNYCDTIALSAADAYRKVERQRRLGEVIVDPPDPPE